MRKLLLAAIVVVIAIVPEPPKWIRNASSR